MITPDKDFTDFLFKDFLFSRPDGFFVEAGANNGRDGSVCYLLEEKHNWTGMNIEPNPYCFEELQKLRPNCINVEGALWYKEGKANLSFETRAPRGFLDGGATITKVKGGGFVKNVPVKTFAIRDIIEKYNIKSIDLMVLDVEGAEIEALQGFIYSNVMPEVLCIEVDKLLGIDLHRILRQLNYAISSTPYKNNEIYIREDNQW